MPKSVSLLSAALCLGRGCAAQAHNDARHRNYLANGPDSAAPKPSQPCEEGAEAQFQDVVYFEGYTQCTTRWVSVCATLYRANRGGTSARTTSQQGRSASCCLRLRVDRHVFPRRGSTGRPHRPQRGRGALLVLPSCSPIYRSRDRSLPRSSMGSAQSTQPPPPPPTPPLPTPTPEGEAFGVLSCRSEVTVSCVLT
jgi:hypothetical protein